MIAVDTQRKSTPPDLGDWLLLRLLEGAKVRHHENLTTRINDANRITSRKKSVKGVALILWNLTSNDKIDSFMIRASNRMP